MPGRKFGHNSNYDEGGMPLGTDTADYDNAEERRMHQVKDKYVEPTTVFDMDYQPKNLPRAFVGTDKEGRPLYPHGKKGFNSAISEEVGTPDQVHTVDIEDPAERRKLLVQEAEDKGFAETPELPKVEEKETVDDIKQDIKDDKDTDDDFRLLLGKEDSKDDKK